MDIFSYKDFFLFGFLFNFAILILWFLLFVFLKDFAFKLHGIWFKHISREAFDVIHYSAIAFYKLLIILFFLTPYLALVWTS